MHVETFRAAATIPAQANAEAIVKAARMPGFRHLLQHAKRGFPAPLVPATTVMERLRRVNFAAQYAGLTPLQRVAMGILRTTLYPVALLPAIVEAIRHLPRFGIAASAADVLPMYAAGLLRNLPPVEYLMFGFGDPTRRRSSGHYLYWMDQPALLWLNRQRGATNDDVQDKARFAILCHAAGLCHAGTLAAFQAGQQTAGPELAALQGEGFWQKPRYGSGGRGCRLWRRAADGTMVAGHDRLSPGQWHQHLRQTDCILQAPLVNHPDLQHLSNGAAVVLRLITVLERSGECTLIGSSVALPQGSSDSTTAALGCVPDLRTGVLRKVSLAGADAATTHPDTGARIVGSVLPCWDACCLLVQQAHRQAFAGFASLGWDVVVTPDGPVLLEANSGWGTMGQQMDFGPLGDTPLARIAADELERAGCN